MPKCSYCDSTIVFGGVQDGDLHFCNQRCRESGSLLLIASQVSDEVVNRRVTEVHQGPCPKCQKVGGIDVFTSHSVWSALVVTTWKSTPEVSCVSCGNKAKVWGTVSSLLFGWWGIPWGLLLTPIQIGRNIWGLTQSQPSIKPSAQLDKIVRLTLAAELKGQPGGVPPELLRSTPGAGGLAPIDAEAEVLRKKYLNHEGGIKVAGSMMLFGVALCLIAILATLAHDKASTAEKTAVIILLLGAAGFHGWVGVKLRRLDTAVKWPATGLFAAWLIGVPVCTVAAIYGLYLLHSAKGKTVLSEPYQAVITATPATRFEMGIASLLGFAVVAIYAFIMTIAFSAPQ